MAPITAKSPLIVEGLYKGIIIGAGTGLNFGIEATRINQLDQKSLGARVAGGIVTIDLAIGLNFTWLTINRTGMSRLLLIQQKEDLFM
ncbi:MAG: hypothetical protein WC686_03020 [Candidatus Shapirobacteria bacterium]